jgi:PAS domain S-box-containing protein
MKIRTRLLFSFYLFGVVLILITIFIVFTDQRVERLNQQEEIARSIDQTARELSYLSNDYLLYREDQQRERWLARFNSLVADVDRLDLNGSDQRLLAEQIKTNSAHLQAVFMDISNTMQAKDEPTQPDYLRFIQVSWSRLEVQNQNIIFNARLLVQRLLDQEDQLRQTNILLIYLLAAVILVYLLTNYFLNYQRVLRALVILQAGTKAIGTGNLEYRIDDQHQDEFGELSRAFNQMTTNLHEITSSKADLEREIAERQMVEEALRTSENRLRSLVEADIIGVFTRDRKGQVKSANAVFLNLVGASSQAVEDNALNVLDLIPPANHDQELEWMQASLMKQNQPQEKIYQRKDGKTIPVLVGEAQVGQGEQFEWIGFVLDLTELKQAQSALAESVEKLRISNQELEQFAFIASHDLKEPLRKIRSFSDMLAKRLGDKLDANTLDLFFRMQNAAERMQLMIDDLLELSRVGRRGEPFMLVSLSDLAGDVVSDLDTRIKAEGGSVEIEPLPMIESDPVQIRQLLQNLIGNAIKYHRPEEGPVIKVWCQEEPQRYNKIPKVTLFVNDNGIGIQEEYLEKIFQPFTRLHGRDAYEGNGMGLAICRKIVERHHGEITAHSILGQGSTFMVTLPVRQKN